MSDFFNYEKNYENENIFHDHYSDKSVKEEPVVNGDKENCEITLIGKLMSIIRNSQGKANTEFLVASVKPYIKFLRRPDGSLYSDSV